MICLVIIQAVQGGRINEEDRFLTRVKRTTCDPQGAEQCALEAAQTYIDAMFENGQPKAIPAGEKPDYQERKTCNFLLETEKCFTNGLLDGCGLSADKLKEIKDASLKKARDAAQALPSWNEEKCQSSVASLGTSLFLVIFLAGFASKKNE